MADLRTSYTLDLEGNLERQARRYGRALDRFSKSGERDLGRLGRATRAFGSGLDRLGNRYTGLLGAAGGGMILRGVVTLDARLTRLGTNADISADKINKLRGRLFEVAQQPDIRIDPNQLLGGVEEVVERVGDYEFAMDNLANIARVIQATGAEGRSVGGIFAEFQKMDLRKPEAVAQAIGTLVTQGKEGAVGLKDMARLAPRVLQAYTSLGRRGPEAVREFGAVFQTAMRGTADPELAATAVERMLAELSNVKIQKKLRKAGIRLFEPGTDEKVLRPINDLVTEIVTKADGRNTIMQSAFGFGDESIRAFRNVMSEYNAGGIKSLSRFMELQGDSTELAEMSARNAGTMSAAVQSLQTALNQFANSKLADPIQDLADAIKDIDPETLQRALTIGASAIGGLGGLIVAAKTIRAAQTVGGLFRKGGKGGVGGMVESATGVMPVYVVNMPGAKGMPGMGGSGGKGAGRAPKVRRPGTWGMIKNAPLRSIGAGGAAAAGTAGLAVAGAGAAGYGAGKLANDYLIDGTRMGDAIGRQITEMLAFFGNDQAQRSIEIMDRAAEKMERAADKIERSETKITLGYDGPVRVPLRRVETRGRDVDLSAGPLRAGMD